MYFKILEHFTIKVLSSWESTVEESSICFGEVPCTLWVPDTIMTGVFDDIEFVDEAMIQTNWKIIVNSSLIPFNINHTCTSPLDFSKIWFRFFDL